MKKKLVMILMCIAMNVALGSMMGLQSQEPPVAGGYQAASTTEPEVITAARFAIKQEKRKKGGRLSLISIERAETQVVAGLNYRLCLKVKIKNKIQSVQAVVYKNLQQKFSLSSWEAGACEGGRGK